MQKALGVLLVCQLTMPCLVFGDERHAATTEQKQNAIAESGAREIARLVMTTPDPRLGRLDGQAEATKRNWVSRHPALFGALIGAGGGLVAGATMENELICSGGDEDCLIYGPTRLGVGALMGAGVGALVGVIVGATRR